MRQLLLALWLLLAATLAVAQAQDVDGTLDGIRQQIDSAQKSLTDTPDDAELLRVRGAALAAQNQADDTAADLAPQLAAIAARLAELGTPTAGTREEADIASQRSQLTRARNTLDSQVKLARLLAVEGEQLAAQTLTLRRSLFQARLGERTRSILGKAFWAELRDDLPGDATRLSALGVKVAAAARAAPVPVWLGAPFVVAAAWAMAWWLRRLARRFITTRLPHGRLRRSLNALLVVLDRMLVVGAPASAIFVALDWGRTLAPATATLLGALVGMMWFGGFLAGLASALISARHPSWRLTSLPDPVATRLRWFPLQITMASVGAWLAERLATTVNASLAMTVAVNCVVALALALTVGLALIRAERVWRQTLAQSGAAPRPAWRAALAGASWLVLAGAVVCLLAGYVAFGSFAVKQVVWAGIVLAAAYLLAALVDDTLMAWAGTPQRDKRDPPSGAGAANSAAAASRALAQAAVLASGLLRLGIVLMALMLLVAPFGEGPSDLLRRSGQWQEGLSIGEIKLLPATVLQALLVLVAGIGIVRYLRRWLAERYLPTTTLDPGMQSSASSLFGYAGIVLAVALALPGVGIGLERVAWVASALSVGIGFGLQAVVQNFVSGLILLAERPVKVGDWVSLGGIEGDIRRINVRATEIQMGDRSTVIVPNSEFITKVVRNVTLADPLGLVQVKLPVPLGSDASQVHALMLAAFTANPDVLESPAPNVLLDGIDASALAFNATGYVDSPRSVAKVRSALLFDVLARLKTAGINLATPPTMLIQAPVPGPGPVPGPDPTTGPGTAA